MQSGTLTKAGAAYSRCLADYLLYEQDTDLVENGKEILVLTGTYCLAVVCSLLCKVCCIDGGYVAAGCLSFLTFCLELSVRAWAAVHYT